MGIPSSFGIQRIETFYSSQFTQDEVHLLTIEFDPEEDCASVLGKEHCDFLEDNGGHAYGIVEDLTDGALELLIEQKLKIFDWLIGHLRIPALQQIIRDFVANNREGIKQ